MANKAQGRRSSKLKGYYTAQFNVTARNKARRAAKRRTKAAFWKEKNAEAVLAKAIGMGE